MSTTVNLKLIKDNYENFTKNIQKRFVICAGTGCIANGALEIYDKFISTINELNLNAVVELKKEEEGIHVSKSGCQGFCQMGALVTVMPDNTMYVKVKVTDVEEIVDAAIIKNEILDRLVYVDIKSGIHCAGIEEIPFYKKQSRYLLEKCGKIDPENIEEYIALDGYLGSLSTCLNMTSEGLCKLILDSGLKGRGGGGFPTGRKWEMARVQAESKKYIICNGDEGDPGAFMDRSVMEGNPHAVIEGMIIAAMAIGADEGYVYVRAEYPLAVKRVKKAVIDARNRGILGKGIFGSTKNFDITVMEGAGAFVCGEETALISSIEGNRGMPSPKPPFPAQKGLFGKPTIINNVETLATLPLILQDNGKKFRSMGTDSSKGTKTFALTGHVVNSGLIEVPFGSTLRQIVDDIAGGVVSNEGKICGTEFKAIQIGGPSGGCLTQEHLDLPLDYESLKSVGAMVGSGGLVVMNTDTCMVKIAQYFMQFTQNESCGKCVVCREGTKQMLNLLNDIVENRATEETIPLLEELAITVQKGSLCGLGKTAPNPVLSTLRYFRDEYNAHVIDKRCPAGECKAYAKYRIVEDKCKGCSLCERKCPVEAITGEKGKFFVIDQSKCIMCGVCVQSCKFSAIVK